MRSKMSGYALLTDEAAAVLERWAKIRLGELEPAPGELQRMRDTAERIEQRHALETEQESS